VNYRLSVLAKQDVIDIYRYTLSTHGEKQADAYLMAIYDGLNRLVTAPEMGEIYITAKGSKFRKFLFSYHYVYYRRGTNNNIEVRRIIHAARDVDGILDEN
jgi:toxin ParE1/3/4